MEEIIKKLEDIIASSKNKKKLNQSERMKAEGYLESLLQGSDTRAAGLDFMISFPADVSANAFLKVWLSIEEKENRELLVDALLKKKNFTGEVANNRLMDLIRVFLPVSNPVALTFLSALGERVTEMGVSMPSDRVAGKFKKMFINTCELLRIKPAECSINAKGSCLIATFLMFILSSNGYNEEIEPEKIRQHIDWLCAFKETPFINFGSIEKIEKGTRHWPEDVQRLCYKAGFIKTIQTSIKPVLQSEKANPCGLASSVTTPDNREDTVQKNVPPVKPKSAEKINQANSPGQSNAMLLKLQQVADHIIHLENELKHKKSELMDRLMELDRERKTKNELERVLRQKEERNENLNIELQGQKEELNNLRQLSINLQKDLAELKDQHEKQLNELYKMIGQRAEQQVQQLRKKLINKLRTDYHDFKGIINEPMTLELGENLKAQLDGIFSQLAEEGIKF